jgi:hypothetical protein
LWNLLNCLILTAYCQVIKHRISNKSSKVWAPLPHTSNKIIAKLILLHKFNWSDNQKPKGTLINWLTKVNKINRFYRLNLCFLTKMGPESILSKIDNRSNYK